MHLFIYSDLDDHYVPAGPYLGGSPSYFVYNKFPYCKFHKDLIMLEDGTIRTPKFTERKLDHTSRENIELEKLLGRPSPFGGGYRDFMALFEWTL
mgnify:CR=1 FL=1